MPASEVLTHYDFSISYGPLDDRMNGLYLPALLRSVRYDRTIGFFSPEALALAARGVHHLIRNRGVMRLLVNAGLTLGDRAGVQEEQDLTSILEEKFLSRLDAADIPTAQKLGVIGRMAEGKSLDIRVAYPCREDGPFGKSTLTGYYAPPCMGIFTDREGNRLCFFGAMDETLYTGDQNYEQLLVYRSWEPDVRYLDIVHQYFERLWEGKEPGWQTLALPGAVMDRIIQFRQRKAADRAGRLGLPSERSPIAADVRKMILSEFIHDSKYFPHSAIREPNEISPGADTHPTGQPLENPESCGLPLVRWQAGPPDPLAIYYLLRQGQVKALGSVSELEEALDGKGYDSMPPEFAAEIKAKEDFYATLAARAAVREKERQAVLKQEQATVLAAARKVLVKAALCDVAKSRHATLFDEDLLAADFDTATLDRQTKKGSPFSDLMALLNQTEKVLPSPSDPFWKEIEGKTLKKIKAIEVELAKEGKTLIETWFELEKKSPVDQRPQTVAARKYFMTVPRERPRLTLMVAPPREERFTRYLPFYTMEALIDKFVKGGNTREEGWMDARIGKKLRQSMFVIRTEGQAMEPLISEGHFSVFDGDVRGGPEGAILLVYGKDLYDADYEGPLMIRCLNRLEEDATKGKYVKIELDALHPDYRRIGLTDVHKDDFKIIGRYLGQV